MKLLKLSLIAMLMALVLLSCKEDSTGPVDDDEEFTIITELQPLNLVIETYRDDKIIDSVRIYKEISEMLPDGIYYWSEYLTNQKVMNLRFFHHPESVSEFDLYLEFESKSFRKGSFNLNPLPSIPYPNYNNPILNSNYYVDSGNLLIKEIKHFENTEGQYFISGEINVIFKKPENENYTTSVKVIYENMSIYLKTYE